MPNLVRSRSWGQVAPPPGSQIDWGHPLAQNLRGLWIPVTGSRTLPDLVNPRNSARLVTADTSSVYRPYGPHIGAVAANVGFENLTPTAALTTFTTGVTWSWLGVVVGDQGASFSTLAQVTWDNANTSPFVVWSYDRSNTNEVRLVYNSAGSLQTATIDATPVKQIPRNFTTSWRFGSAPRAYRDGVLLATGSGTSAPTVGATPALQIGGNGTLNARGSNTISMAVALWDGALSQDQVEWLAAEPYAFIQPPGPKVFYLGLGGVAATTASAGLATATGSALGASISLAPNAGLTSATGTANAPAGSVASSAGVASATGIAGGPSASLAISAGLASATAAAQSPSAAIIVNAGFGSATATAYQPTASGGQPDLSSERVIGYAAKTRAIAYAAEPRVIAYAAKSRVSAKEQP